MPPKIKATADNGVPKDIFRFVLTVFESCDTISPDWNTVAAKNRIGYGRNAAGKFRDLVKKYGYEFKNNALVSLDEDSTAPSISTPAAAANGTTTTKVPKAKAKAAKAKSSNTPLTTNMARAKKIAVKESKARAKANSGGAKTRASKKRKISAAESALSEDAHGKGDESDTETQVEEDDADAHVDAYVKDGQDENEEPASRLEQLEQQEGREEDSVMSADEGEREIDEFYDTADSSGGAEVVGARRG